MWPPAPPPPRWPTRRPPTSPPPATMTTATGTTAPAAPAGPAAEAAGPAARAEPPPAPRTPLTSRAGGRPLVRTTRWDCRGIRGGRRAGRPPGLGRPRPPAAGRLHRRRRRGPAGARPARRPVAPAD